VKIIIDADIITYILKKDSEVSRRFELVTISENPEYYLCPVVYYQIKRWLIDIRAKRKLQHFDSLAKSMIWLNFEQEDWERAIIIWLAMKKKGFDPKHQDADILIASQAERIGAKVITNNLKHFNRIYADCETWKD
jgi:predicted nucleic acid-binding protein